MNKPHKHAAIIKKWADGTEIEFRDVGLLKFGTPWHPVGKMPCWFDTNEYRVKPDPPPRELWGNTYPSGWGHIHASKSIALKSADSDCLGTYRYVLAEDQE